MNMLAIRARERLENIADIGLALSSHDQSMGALSILAEQAYSDDEKSLGIALEAITRKHR